MYVFVGDPFSYEFMCLLRSEKLHFQCSNTFTSWLLPLSVCTFQEISINNIYRLVLQVFTFVICYLHFTIYKLSSQISLRYLWKV